VLKGNSLQQDHSNNRGVAANMLRQDFNRIDPKRRNVIDYRKKQFADPQSKESSYPHRLNFYVEAPTTEITLEQFEQWAIDRLHILAELETCSARNKTAAEATIHMKPLFDKYLPLSANSSGSPHLFAQRQKDHYGHFILRLAFASTADLRQRFVRAETMLFRMRFLSDDSSERDAFVSSLNIDWFERVTDEEKSELHDELKATSDQSASSGEESWFKVDWMRVPELVEGRRVLLRHGKAFVPRREQISMVVAEFSTRLEQQMEVWFSPFPFPLPLRSGPAPAHSRTSLQPGHFHGSTKMTG
jgi:DNA primase large subunit